MSLFDVIVVGLGAIGSAAVYQMSQRGNKVLGIDAFTPPHDRGSSHGSSRVIRQAYFEHPSYVPLLLRSYELWERLQTDTSSKLLHVTGGLMIGEPRETLVAGSIKSAEMYMLAHEMLDAAQMRRRFPQFILEPSEIALYEPKAGYLYPEKCIRLHLTEASRYGAELRFDEPIVSWAAEHSGEGVTVKTACGNYHAKHLVLATGAWTPKILSQLGLPMTVIRKVMCWFEPVAGMYPFLPERCPIYMWEPKKEALFYGFPASGEKKGIKVAIHRRASHEGEEECSPDSIDRKIHRDDEAAVRSMIAHRIPGLNGKLVDASVCMYTMTPDEHFIIDQHPEYQQVCIAAGFSGHGFKFSSVMGEILADLAAEGTTTHNINLFRMQRSFDHCQLADSDSL